MSILGRSEKSYKTKQHQALSKFGAVVFLYFPSLSGRSMLIFKGLLIFFN